MVPPIHTPPRSTRGAEVSLSRRYAIAVEMTLVIPQGNSRVPNFGGVCRVCEAAEEDGNVGRDDEIR